MKNSEVEYKTGVATKENVQAHLLACNANFVPPLSERIDISEYAGKIVAMAVTFEAWRGRELVGLIAAYFNDPAGKTGFITNVSVYKDLMGAGIASELLERCVNYARENNFEEICLEVNSQNLPAVSFYRKYNFQEHDLKKDSLIMKRKI